MTSQGGFALHTTLKVTPKTASSITSQTKVDVRSKKISAEISHPSETTHVTRKPHLTTNVPLKTKGTDGVVSKETTVAQCLQLYGKGQPGSSKLPTTKRCHDTSGIVTPFEQFANVLDTGKYGVTGCSRGTSEKPGVHPGLKMIAPESSGGIYDNVLQDKKTAPPASMPSSTNQQQESGTLLSSDRYPYLGQY